MSALAQGTRYTLEQVKSKAERPACRLWQWLRHRQLTPELKVGSGEKRKGQKTQVLWKTRGTLSLTDCGGQGTGSWSLTSSQRKTTVQREGLGLGDQLFYLLPLLHLLAIVESPNTPGSPVGVPGHPKNAALPSEQTGRMFRAQGLIMKGQCQTKSPRAPSGFCNPFMLQPQNKISTLALLKWTWCGHNLHHWDFRSQTLVQFWIL